MLRLILAVTCLAALAAACGGGDKPAPATTPAAATTTPARAVSGSSLASHETELRETIVAAYKEILGGGAVNAYAYAASDFKDKCPLGDFIGVMALVKVFLGDFDKDTVGVEVTGVRYDGDRAYVTAKATIDGESIGDDQEEELTDYWIYEDGGWKWSTDDAQPCNTDFTASDTPDDKTPQTGPGLTRASAVPPGTPVRTGDLQVEVLDVNFDATSVLAADDSFPSTPEAGRHFVLIQLRVTHAGSGDDTVDASTSNFSITGSGNVLYDGFGDASCGFGVPDELDATLFAGGTAEGNVCFQVPTTESDLLLVVEPQFSFDDEERRFLALQ